MNTQLAAPRELAPVVAAWLGCKAKRTQGEYLKCVGIFAQFTDSASPADALAYLLSLPRGLAVQTVETWKAAMMQAGLAPATTNQRLAAVRSFVTTARRHGLVEFDIDVDGVKKEPRRDMRGPSWENYEALVATEPSVRNKALLRLLGDRGVRLAEAAALEIADFDGDAVAVVGKGRREKERLVVNDRTRAALCAWVKERGKEPGSLFGIAPDAIYDMVERAGLRVGIKTSPHRLRHAAVTRALDVTNGDVRRVRAFSRHSNVATVLIYDDARSDHATQVAAMVGS